MSIYAGLDENVKKTIFTLNSYMDRNFRKGIGTFSSNNSLEGFKNGIEVRLIINNDIIKKISLYKEKDLGNYYTIDDYDFFTGVNWDNRLSINRDRLADSSDFKKLIDRNFNRTDKNSIDSYLVNEGFSASVGDKDSLYLHKALSVELNGNEKSNDLLDIIKALVEIF